MPTTKVQITESTVKNENNDDYQTTQYRTTIPKQLAEALGLEQGDEVEWEIVSGSKLSMEKVNE